MLKDKLEFPEEDFFAHSLQCLRKAFSCKKCGEIVSLDKKKEHLEHYRDTKLVLNAINSGDIKFINLSLSHGFDPKKVLDNKGNTLLHLLCAKGNSGNIKEILNNEVDNNSIISYSYVFCTTFVDGS